MHWLSKHGVLQSKGEERKANKNETRWVYLLLGGIKGLVHVFSITKLDHRVIDQQPDNIHPNTNSLRGACPLTEGVLLWPCCETSDPSTFPVFYWVTPSPTNPFPFLVLSGSIYYVSPGADLSDAHVVLIDLIWLHFYEWSMLFRICSALSCSGFLNVGICSMKSY